MRILKFGEASLDGSQRIEAVVEIISEAISAGPVVVVTSALGGVTAVLDETVKAAESGSEGYHRLLETVAARHHLLAEELVIAGKPTTVAESMDAAVAEAASSLEIVADAKQASDRQRDEVLACGHRLAALLVAFALVERGYEAEVCDARELIVSADSFSHALVDKEASSERLRAHFADQSVLQVVTGFIAATPGGETTTLGRGGSDYTAALIGAALAADRIEIWTGADGVMSADPRLVPSAFRLEALSFDELSELAQYNRSAVQSMSVQPARASAVPLVIRNTFNPTFEGTRVVEGAPASSTPVRGISSSGEIAMMRLVGDGMAGVPGIAERLFGALAKVGVSVIMISQSPSEHSISFAVEPSSVERAESQVAATFELEMRAGLVDKLVVESGLSIIGVVGEAMCEIPGVAGRVFSVLGEHGVNVRAIAQDSSELNISMVVASRDEGKAALAIHEAFFPEAGPGIGDDPPSVAGRGRIPVAVLGATGRVGQRLLVLLDQHPWFAVKQVTTSGRPARTTYQEAVHWLQEQAIPEGIGELELVGLEHQIQTPLVISALDEAVAIPVEEGLANAGHLVISAAPRRRDRADVPMVVAEVNPDHLALVNLQPYRDGALVSSPGAAAGGLALALKPLADEFGLAEVHVVTLKSLAGASSTVESALEVFGNVVPYAAGESDPVEDELCTVLGRIRGERVDEADCLVNTQGARVPIVDGQLHFVSVVLTVDTTEETIRAAWSRFKGVPQHLRLPTAPERPLIYLAGESQPQARRAGSIADGMSVVLGGLRHHGGRRFDFMMAVDDNGRGGAGGALLTAELAVSRKVVASLRPPTET